MSLNRFWEINRFIRFDDGRTRAERKKSDKAAAISEVFEMLLKNLQSCYVAGEYVTVDEQLFPYRGGTGFTQYIPSKPAKIGLLYYCQRSTTIQKFRAHKKKTSMIVEYNSSKGGVDNMDKCLYEYS
uniref:DDE_Tnp_1_7 domain-containing protein n=1 Tax=Anopheles epiroticus TaxID=199890 RepID=A0A182PWM9_9DIPT